MSRMLRAALTETRNAYGDMPTRVADLTQLSARLDALRTANVEHHLNLVRTAAEHQVQLICFGELFAGPYFALHREPMWRELAEDARTGPTVSAMREAAREHSMVIVAPIYELCPETQRRFNTAVVIDGEGEVLGKYRKTHIPQGENEQGAFHERFYYDASDGNLGPQERNVSKNPFYPVWDTGVGRLGVNICYDRHFPGVVRTLAQEGAELVVSPAVTFGEKSRRMWAMEFPVDAARHGVFIGGSNRMGTEPPFEQAYFGGSYFAGPNGRLTTAVEHDNLVIADLNMDELSGADPSGWNLSKDLRPDIYSR